jgi:hypothetical protein
MTVRRALYVLFDVAVSILLVGLVFSLADPGRFLLDVATYFVPTFGAVLAVSGLLFSLAAVVRFADWLVGRRDRE